MISWIAGCFGLAGMMCEQAGSHAAWMFWDLGEWVEEIFGE